MPLAITRPDSTPRAAGVSDGDDHLDRVFFALSDPIRRTILERLDGNSLLVSELAAPFPISLQAVSRHIHVLVDARLVRQGPIHAAAVWINRYSKYWQAQFDLLAMTLEDLARKDATANAGEHSGQNEAPLIGPPAKKRYRAKKEPNP
jgi:DNA-binding transcriptional ArsR family regulator